MAPITLRTIHDELHNLQRDIQFIKHAIAEDFELSGDTQKKLIEARKSPRTAYLSQKEMEQEFLR
ncbi:MAG TPA: hypothetical protein VJC16_05485 [Candidatus Nanoarchaeia archaeon]|nr:hypothetical protein [Candidatus Nanoarchaeia archaeon]